MPAAPAAPPPPAAAPAAAPAVVPPNSGGFVPPPPPPASERFADVFADIDSVIAGKPAVKPAAPAPKPVAKAPDKAAEKPADKPAEKPTEKAADKPDETLIDPAEPKVDPIEEADVPDKKFQTAKDVREWGRKLHKENTALKKEIEAAKASKGKDDPSKAFQDKLADMEKRHAQLQEELKFTSYERSDDYKEKYLTPMTKAWQSAFEDVSQITIEDDSGSQRKATEQDFEILVRMPIQQAATKARELFGDLSTEVMAHRRRIIELNTSRQEALETYRKQGAEREQQTAAHHESSRKARQELFESTVKEAPEKFPELFAPVEGDEEGNALLESGNKLADMVFKGAQGISEEAKVKADAEVRNRAAAFGRQVYLNKRLKEENASLKEKLKAFEESEPAGGDPGRTEEGRELTIDEEIDLVASGKKAA